jgi:hypothetical protein
LKNIGLITNCIALDLIGIVLINYNSELGDKTH